MSSSGTAPTSRRSTRTGRRRARRGGWVRRTLLWLTGLALLGILLAVGIFAWAYSRTDVPEPNDFAEAQSSILYYADGETELARFTGGYDRESVPLSEVPEHVRLHVLPSGVDRTPAASVIGQGSVAKVEDRMARAREATSAYLDGTDS